MTTPGVCQHCQGSLSYAGKAGRKSVSYCGPCGCVYVDGKHHRDGSHHRTPEEKAAVMEAIKRDPEGRELFG